MNTVTRQRRKKFLVVSDLGKLWFRAFCIRARQNHSPTSPLATFTYNSTASINSRLASRSSRVCAT